MAGIFGHRWVSSYGAEPSDTWLAALCHLTPDQLLEGIVRCMRWEEDWPPSLPKFLALCEHSNRKFFVAEKENPVEVARRKAAGLEQVANWREEMRYTEWDLKNSGRCTSMFDDLLFQIRQKIAVARMSRDA